jgi:hypothetical protein
MNSFQRKSLYAALAGAGALGVAATANAVSLNPNGLGQVLIYPYYTTNADSAGNAYNSLLSVVNTTDSAKAVKVRFLESFHSLEVLDFNLFLSKFDVWTAAILPSSSGGAKIITQDNSCTIPQNSLLKAGVDFVNSAYAGDGAGSTLDRTKEGYVEIIEMTAYTTFNCTSVVVTHVNSVPPCQSAKHPLNDASASADSFYASGGLFGGMVLINVGEGQAYSQDAVALMNFNAGPIYFNAGSILPNLANVGESNFASLTTKGPKSLTVGFQRPFDASDVGVYGSYWPNPQYLSIDAVSAVLMHDTISNEYALDASILAGTDWVVTMPTKRFYINNGTGPAIKLFQNNFNKTDLSCDDIFLNIYDREENTTTSPVSFSPPSPGQTAQLCYEANVITFANSNVLATHQTKGLHSVTPPSGFTHGWLKLGFAIASSSTVHTLGNQTHSSHLSGVSSLSTGETKTYIGLPVVGFAVDSFTNGTLVVGGQNVLARYGLSFIQKGSVRVVNQLC